MDDLRTGLSYGDVLLVPKRSSVDSRGDVDLSTRFTPGLELRSPLVSAAMDTVTEGELAAALSRAGGIGVVHRFLTPEQQAAEVERVPDGERVAAAVGIDEDHLARAERVLAAGADTVVVDVAHGHLERTLETVGEIAAEFPDASLLAGNVATPAGVRDLAAAGADGVKVGVGPGSHCTTREVAGAGVPQLTAVDDCAEAASEVGVTVCADGGIRSSGDVVKALMAGADTVMLAVCSPAPRRRRVRSSRSAATGISAPGAWRRRRQPRPARTRARPTPTPTRASRRSRRTRVP